MRKLYGLGLSRSDSLGSHGLETTEASIWHQPRCRVAGRSKLITLGTLITGTSVRLVIQCETSSGRREHRIGIEPGWVRKGRPV